MFVCPVTQTVQIWLSHSSQLIITSHNIMKRAQIQLQQGILTKQVSTYGKGIVITTSFSSMSVFSNEYSMLTSHFEPNSFGQQLTTKTSTCNMLQTRGFGHVIHDCMKNLNCVLMILLWYMISL